MVGGPGCILQDFQAEDTLTKGFLNSMPWALQAAKVPRFDNRSKTSNSWRSQCSEHNKKS